MDTSPSAAISTIRALRIFWVILRFVLAAFVIAITIRIFVAQPFEVSGGSMEPTLNPNEYLIIDKLTYQFQNPERGDVIIMRYPLDSSQFFIKRIIGLPGETVSITKGVITILQQDGSTQKLSEPYLVVKSTKDVDTTATLADDEYFVLGDNREQSSDSRDWGPLQKRFIVGKAFVRLFPLSHIQLLPGKHVFSEL